MKEFELSDGRKVTIQEATGATAEQAMRLADGKTERYMTSLMSITTSIDGKGVVPEDLTALPLKDYTKIQTEFAELNF